MKIELVGLTDGGRMPDAHVFNGFGCEGANISPAVRWSGAPDGTKSFAITVYDPDAPTGSGWWHWLAFNIPTNTNEIPGGASMKDMPRGTVESITDYGAPGYGGACPPQGHGDHRYIFTVFALDVDTLPLDGGAMPAMVGYYLNQHKISSATATLLYGR